VTYVPPEAVEPGASLPPAMEVGRAMPAFTLPAPGGGARALASFTGKPLVLNFFASWCPSCWAEIPAITAVYEAFSPRGLQVLGIGVLDDARSQAEMVRRLRIPYPTVYDAEGRVVGEVLKLRSMPTTVLVDRHGVVRFKWEGVLDEATLRREVVKWL